MKTTDSKDPRRILVVPAILPLTLDESIRVIEELTKDPDLQAIALQLRKSKQRYLDRVFREAEKIDESKIGLFYPIVNYAIQNDMPTYAFGHRDFSNLEEVFKTYKRLSEKRLEVGPLAYVCSKENARLIRRIHIID